MAAIAMVAWVAVGVAGPSSAQGRQTPPSAEAWYQYAPDDEAVDPSPLCDTGLPLPTCPGGVLEEPATPRVNPYPANTLHVAVTDGSDSAITFLELHDPSTDEPVTGGTLRLPIAGDAGDVAPETARFRACVISGVVTDGQEAGDPATAPAVDCSVSSPAVYEEGSGDEQGTPLPRGPGNVPGTFVVDLDPLVDQWRFAVPAVALVPTEDARVDGDTWHVAFDGRDRDGEDTRPITFTLGVGEPPADEPTPTPRVDAAPPDPAQPPPPPASLPAPSPAVTAPSLPEQASPPRAVPPTIAPPDPVAGPDHPQAPVAAPLVALPIGIVYPQAYFIPAIVIAFGIAVGSSLRRNLDPFVAGS